MLKESFRAWAAASQTSAQAARLAFLAFLAWRSSSRRRGLLATQLVRQRQLRLESAFARWSCWCQWQMRKQLAACSAREEEDTRRWSDMELKSYLKGVVIGVEITKQDGDFLGACQQPVAGPLRPHRPRARRARPSLTNLSISLPLKWGLMATAP